MILLPAGFVLLAAAACSRGGGDAATTGGVGVQTQQTPSGVKAVGARGDSRPVILFLGTSLTAGLGLDPDSAYPAFIQRALDSLHLDWRAENGGVSGETSAGALRRLPWVLGDKVRILVIETGANDGLRGLDLDSTRANLEAIVREARRRDSTLTIVLAGMEAPPNMGPAYTARFRSLYSEVAREDRLPLIPFLLAGVGGVDSLNQADGIHPTARGAAMVAQTVWRTLAPLVRAPSGAAEGR